MRSKQTGFIKFVIILVIALVILGYFGFNIREIIQSPSVSGNLNYGWGLVTALWNKVLVVPVTFIWNKIIVGIFWNGLVGLINHAQVAPAVTP